MFLYLMAVLAVTHGVEEGENIKCHACGWPLTKEEAELPAMSMVFPVFLY